LNAKPRLITSTILLISLSLLTGIGVTSDTEVQAPRDTSKDYVYVEEEQAWFIALDEARAELDETQTALTLRIDDKVAGKISTKTLTALKTEAVEKIAVLPETRKEGYFRLSPANPVAFIKDLEADVADAITPATEAVVAWEKELAAEKERIRIAEEKRKAEEARKAAEAAANARRNTGGGRTYTNNGVYTKNVWTAGFQNEVDQCRGAVDLTANYGVATIAEHSHCGGSSFPTAAGTTVAITGHRAGTYKVLGVVARLDATKHTTADIPRGYDLLFQTCQNGFRDMRFIALQKIG